MVEHGFRCDAKASRAGGFSCQVCGKLKNKGDTVVAFKNAEELTRRCPCCLPLRAAVFDARPCSSPWRIRRAESLHLVERSATRRECIPTAPTPAWPLAWSGLWPSSAALRLACRRKTTSSTQQQMFPWMPDTTRRLPAVTPALPCQDSSNTPASADSAIAPRRRGPRPACRG